MMMGCSGGFTDPNMNNNRDLPDYCSIKATNLHHHHHAALLTPKLSSTSNMSRNPVLPFNDHHHPQMLPVVTLSQQGRSKSGCLYSDKQPAAAAPGRRCRWNPTTEQIMALKDLYQSGIKIPTAQQIRQVTARLRNYGRIEGKNVYYWFQNHRARERQTRRQELMSMDQSTDSKRQQQTFTNNTVSDLKDKESAGVAFVRFEDEQQNKWTLTNCTGLSDQETSSPLQDRMMSTLKRNSSRELVELSNSLENASAALTCTKFLDFHHYYHYDYSMALTAPNIDKETEEESRETQTLELFPLKSDNLKGAKDTKLAISRTTSTDSTTADLLADQYFLFL